MKINEQQFDDTIRKKLQPNNATFQPKHWALFEEQLDATAPSSFDTVIKDKLTNIAPTYNTTHWEQLAQHLDRFDAEPQALDEAVREQIRSYRVASQHTHWHKMEAHLDYLQQIQQRVHQYKLMEIAAVVLLLLSIIQFDTDINVTPAVQQRNNYAQELKTNAATPNATTNKHTQPKEQVISKSGYQKMNTHKIASSNTASKKQTTAQPEERNAINAQRDMMLPATTHAPVDDSPYYLAEQFAAILQKPEQPTAAALNYTPQTKENTIAPTPNNGYQQRSPVVLLAPLAQPFPAFSCNEPMLSNNTPRVLRLLQKSSVRLAMFSTGNYNYIQTPYDSDYEQNGFNRTSLGYGAGGAISLLSSKWEFSAGATYAAIEYTPRNIKEIFGSILQGGFIAKEFRNFSLSTLNIPVSAQYRFFEKGRWKMYGLAGLSAHIVLSAEYAKRETTYGNPNIFARIEADDNAIIDKKVFDGGLLDGGELERNHYFTANFGVGAEYGLSSRWALFMQPTYQHYITKSGIGPSKDQISNLSILTGVKVKL